MRSPVRLRGAYRALSWLVLVSSLALAAVGCVQPELADMDDGELAPLVQSGDALTWIPADAAIVAVVPDLAALSDDMSLLGQQLAVPAAEWELLPALRELTGMHVGVREDGAFLVVFPDAASVIDSDEPPMLVLVPVTDYDVFLSNFGAVAETTAPTYVQAAYDMDFYALQLQGYAILGRDVEQVAAFRPALTEGESIAPLLGQLGGEIRASSDATLVVNMAALAPFIDSADANFLGQAMTHYPGFDALSPPDRDTISALCAAFADAAVDGTTAFVAGIDVEQTGLDINFSVSLAPDSVFGAMLNTAGGAAALLGELPDLPGTNAAAMSMRGIDREALADWIIGALPNDGTLAELVAELAELTRSTTGMAGLWSPSTAGPEGTSTVHSLSLMHTDDGADVARTYERYLRYLEGFAMPLPILYPEPDTQVTASAEFVVEYAPGETTWGDATVDRYTMEMVVPGSYRDAALEAGANWVLETYPTRYDGVLAVESDRVLGSSGFDDGILQDMLAGRTDASIADRAQLVELRESTLRPDPFVEMSIDLSHIWQYWHGESAQPERLMAVYGHLSDHEAGLQLILPADSLRPF